MAWSIGLNIGKSFAEIVAQKETLCHEHRWYVPKNPLPQALSSFFTSHSISEIDHFQISTNLGHKILQQRIGVSPAFLTTSGFENWLEMSLPLETNYLTTQPRRSKSPLTRDLIFGISERTNAEGQVEKSIEEPELEFLTSKLKMSHITHVSLGFLHSHKNSENEKKAAEYLKAQGFKVFTSYQLSHIENEKARWWNAALNAYLSPIFEESFSDISLQLVDKVKMNGTFELLSSDGFFPYTESNKLLTSLHGCVTALQKYLPQLELPVESVIYCGLEDFLWIPLEQKLHPLWVSEFGNVALKSPEYKRIKTQPTQKIGKSFWGSAFFQDSEIGYEPGPMSMGRGLAPTLLDIFHIQGLVKNVPGFSELVDKKFDSRIFENLITFSKEARWVEEFNENDIANWLQEAALESWYMEITELTQGKTFALCGPLADTLAPLLKEYTTKIRHLKGEGMILAKALVNEAVTPHPETSETLN